MIFRNEILEKIKAGKVSMAFRRWQKLGIKVEGTLKTSIGILEFTSIELVSESSLTESEAKKAGMANREALIKELNARPLGDIYKIRFKLTGEDPRISLRENKKMTKSDYDLLKEKLARLDHFSKNGPWTHQVLEVIKNYPGESSAVLAGILHTDQAKLKLNIRKLKNLGLTISLGTGYQISPRGKALIAKL